VDNFYKSLKVRGNFTIRGVDNSVDKGVNNFSVFLSLQVIHRLSTGYPQVIHRVIHRLFVLLRVMSVYRSLNAIDDSAELFVFLQAFFYSAAGIQHSRVILASEPHADHRI